jgi:hypothetical protein
MKCVVRNIPVGTFAPSGCGSFLSCAYPFMVVEMAGFRTARYAAIPLLRS